MELSTMDRSHLDQNSATKSTRFEFVESPGWRKTAKRPLRSILRRVGLRARREFSPASSRHFRNVRSVSNQLESYLFGGRAHQADTCFVDVDNIDMASPSDSDALHVPNGGDRQPRVSIVDGASSTRTSVPSPSGHSGTSDASEHPNNCECDACLINRPPGQNETAHDRKITPLRAYGTVAVLFVVNLLNYVDRYTVNGLLMDVQKYFSVASADLGLITTVFMVAYLAFSPVFGYFGDRYTRRYIMAIGVSIWVCAVLASTFVSGDQFWLFLLLRGVVGIGEASYATVAPTLIADLFALDRRSQMLMVFYFAIPVGAGLGFVIGSEVGETLTSDWRVTPPLGVIAVCLILFLVPEPPRGQADEAVNSGIKVKHTAKLGFSAMLHDWAYLARNGTFVFVSLGFTGACFAIGSLSAWIAYTVQYAVEMRNPGEQIGDVEKSHIAQPARRISTNVGIITMASGFLGVTCGQLWATKWRRTNVRADCLVCAISALMAVPFVYLGLTFVDKWLWFAYVSGWGVALIELPCADDPATLHSQYVVTPTRRSMATAIETTMSHLLGDAFSPLLVGAVSDWVRSGSQSAGAHFISLQYALYLPNMVLCAAALFFFIAALYVAGDKKQALLETQASFDGILDTTLPSGPPAMTSNSANLLPRSVGTLPTADDADQGYSNQSYENDIPDAVNSRRRPGTVS